MEIIKLKVQCHKQSIYRMSLNKGMEMKEEIVSKLEIHEQKLSNLRTEKKIKIGGKKNNGPGDL